MSSVPIKKRLRSLVTVFLAVGVAAALAGCGSNTAPEGASGSDKGSIVVVHDQSAGDGSVIDSQLAGLKQVGEELGYETQSVFVADPANYESTLRNVADTGAAVIVTSFFRISDAFNTVAADYPEIKFVHLYADPAEPSLDNLRTVSYEYFNVMYLAGVFAATVSETGKVAWIGGDSQPMMAADFNAFIAGAKSVSESIEVTPGVVGSWDDPAKGQAIANQLYSDGVDVIQADAGGAESGIITAATQQKKFVIASGAAAFENAPEAALAASVLDLAPSLVANVKEVLSSDFKGGHLLTGVGDALKVLMTPNTPTDPAAAKKFAEAVKAVEVASNALRDGTIKVPFITDMP